MGLQDWSSKEFDVGERPGEFFFYFDDIKIIEGRSLFVFVWCAQQVPGATGNFVFIKDAVYEKPDISLLPFPTYFAPEDEDTDNLKPLVAELGDVDPFIVTD